MEIDNSRANTFRTCPWMYYEQYVRGGRGIEPVPTKGEGYTPIQLGDRGHQLMEEFYKKAAPGSLYAPKEGPLEEEVQWLLAEYERHYPNDAFEILDVERTFRVALPRLCPECYSSCRDTAEGVGIPAIWWCDRCQKEVLPGERIAIGKIDLFVRALATFDEFTEGELYIMDHKFEKRGAKSNHPQKWAARDQASLYLWAAQQIYKKPVSNFVVNICTRPSEAGKVGPTFRRQKLERSRDDLYYAVRDLVVVADDIERYTRAFGDAAWPANREECYGWGTCDYYLVHRYGEDVTEILKHKYRERGEYLHLGGVPIIQP